MAVLSGILQVLPFPIAGPTPLWRTAFCWVALLPLLCALLANNKEGNPLRLYEGAILGYLCGFVWYLGNCYWIYQTMYLYGGLAKPIAAGILVLFCLYLGLYHALFGMLVTACRRLGRQLTLVLIPFIWVAVELARARITGFPWDQLGVAQVDNSLLAHLAPIAGVYGLSFIIVAVNVLWLICIRVRERRFTRLAFTVGGVAIILLYLVALRHLQPPAHLATSARATLLQENLAVGSERVGPEPSLDELIDSFSQLSLHPPRSRCNGIPELSSTTCIVFASPPQSVQETAPPTPANLIVWPEAPAPFAEEDPRFRLGMSSLARAANAPVIVDDLGTTRSSNPTASKVYDRFNSASFLTPDGAFAGRYDKMHLVPFGEYVPFKSLFFFAGDLLAEAGDLSAGAHRTVFTYDGHSYGTFICYESTFADEVRLFVLKGADVLVNISDDGWYGDTSAPWQHLNMVRMRAIENHRWVLRSTNTGVTAVIDPYGRVTAAAPRHIRTALYAGFGYEHDITFYTKHGDLFAYLCALITTLAFVYSFRRKIN
ncbi:apolipoprotein N-acyltransferase [Edaphobacter dinghuensis]|uniref:Apolipoprotein N-acyltransferase n=2 Tax=Edaphobacter dinghuensis TaxID=1560005 RepID=A0A917M5Z5_9BACT|nr:apolipoprotein N-acyltransferase [Edaphobacter dinghuensis]GGG80106.1 apolipoprotein N-acyltransferase [Edaphobacter dinghuensis]